MTMPRTPACRRYRGYFNVGAWICVVKSDAETPCPTRVFFSSSLTSEYRPRLDLLEERRKEGPEMAEIEAGGLSVAPSESVGCRVPAELASERTAKNPGRV